MFGFAEMENAEAHLQDQLAEMHRHAQAGRLKGTSDQKIRVLLLSRYRKDRPPGLDRWQRNFGDFLDIGFRTVHASKGLEADYVMLLNMVEGAHGFPSQVEDDPVLQLPMPTPDPFPMGEERRLFYVALTRAKRQIRIYTSLASPSRFLVELSDKGAIKIDAIDGDPLVAYFRENEPGMLPRLLITPGDPTTEVRAACFARKLRAFLDADNPGFENTDRQSRLRRMQGDRQPRETGADHDEVDILVGIERRRGDLPLRRGPCPEDTVHLHVNAANGSDHDLTFPRLPAVWFYCWTICKWSLRGSAGEASAASIRPAFALMPAKIDDLDLAEDIRRFSVIGLGKHVAFSVLY